MLIYLSLNFVRAHGIDLADFGSGADGLAEDHVQKAQFAVDGRFHNEVGFALTDHLHIEKHALQALLHPVNLGTAVQAVLDGAFADQVVFLLGKPIILLGLQILLPGDEFILVKGLLLLVGTAQAFHLDAVFQHVLTHIQLLLLHGNLRIALDVFLLRQVGFGIQDLHVQVVIGEHQDGVAGFHRGTFFDEDFLHDTAFLRAQLDGGHGLHAAADADIVVELALDGVGDGNRILIHAQGLVIGPCNQVHDECQQQGAQPIGESLPGECYPPTCFLLNDLIHSLRHARLDRASLIG